MTICLHSEFDVTPDGHALSALRLLRTCAQVVKQCVATEGVEPDYVRAEILPEFFRAFWVRRMALDRRNYRQLVETTVELANKARAPPCPFCACCLLPGPHLHACMPTGSACPAHLGLLSLNPISI